MWEMGSLKEERACYLVELKEALKELVREQAQNSFNSTENAPLTFSSGSVHFLLSCLEKILSFRLKSTGLINKKQLFYWDYLQNISSSIPGGERIVKDVDNLRTVKTCSGAGKAFLCKALNEKDLGTYLSALIYNKELTRCVHRHLQLTNK